MTTETMNIQLILSKLITNPRCLIRALGNPNEYFTELLISGETLKQLVDFINTNSHQFLSSSLFLARKRFLTLLETLNIYRNIKTSDEIDIFWNKYLSSFKLDDHAPKNPMYESIDFCHYIKNNEKIDEIEDLILDYEITRNNIILAYNTWPHTYFLSSLKINDVILNELNDYEFFFHPCSKIIKFSGNISDLIRVCNTSINNTELKNIFKKSHSEELMFYKNYNTGKIISIKVTEPLKNLIRSLKEIKTHKYTSPDFIENNFGLNTQAFIQTINNLIKNGVCMLLPSKNKGNNTNV